MVPLPEHLIDLSYDDGQSFGGARNHNIIRAEEPIGKYDAARYALMSPEQMSGLKLPLESRPQKSVRSRDAATA